MLPIVARQNGFQHGTRRPLPAGSDLKKAARRRPGSRGYSEIRIIFAFDPRPVGAAAARRRQDRELAALDRDNIPIAERLYLEYTAQYEG